MTYSALKNTGVSLAVLGALMAMDAAPVENK